MTVVLEATGDDFQSWLGCQRHRGDEIGDLARQLCMGTIWMSNLPASLRPVMSNARIEYLSAGPVLVGDDVVARVAQIRQAAGLLKVSARRQLRQLSEPQAAGQGLVL